MKTDFLLVKLIIFLLFSRELRITLESNFHPIWENYTSEEKVLNFELKFIIFNQNWEIYELKLLRFIKLNERKLN